MDKVILSPDESGYSFRDGIETLRAILDSGMGRYGRGVVNAAVAMNVQWTCTPAQFEYMQGVHDTHVSEGYAPFAIDLFFNTAEYVEMQVRMMPGTYGLKSHAGEAYVVGCSLEVQPPNKYTPATALEAFTLIPDAAGYSFDRMAIAVHTALQGGLGRVRNDLIGASTTVRVQWTVNPVEFAYIRNYYANWVMNPVPFEMTLILDTAAPSAYQCQFIPGSMSLNNIVGRGLILSAHIEALPVITPPEVETPLWLDTYTGAAEVLLQSHAQDVPLNSSVWLATNNEFNPQLWLNGSGGAVVQQPDPGDFSSFARTDFADEFEGQPLQLGYRIEIDFTDLINQPGGEAIRTSQISLSFVSDQFILFAFTAPVAGTTENPDNQWSLRIAVGAFADQTVYRDEQAALIVMTVHGDNYTLTVNGIDLGTFAPEADAEGSPFGMPTFIWRWQNSLEMGSVDFVNTGSPIVSRTAIYGQLATNLNWLFFNEADGSEPLNTTGVSTPIPFADGISCVNDDAAGSNEQAIGGIFLVIPLQSDMPLTANYKVWNNLDIGSTIEFSVREASYGEESPYFGVNREVYCSAAGSNDDFIGWSGGTLTLYSADGVSTTVITFLPSTGTNPPVMIEYVGA